MAIVTPVIVPVTGANNLDGWQVTWSGMHNGDVGAPVGNTIGGAGFPAITASGGGLTSGFADKTVQIVGTFGAAGSATVEGSNDGGSNWFALTDPLGNVIAITAAAMKEVTEATIWLRAHVTNGDGTTNLTVTMFLRKTNLP